MKGYSYIYIPGMMLTIIEITSGSHNTKQSGLFNRNIVFMYIPEIKTISISSLFSFAPGKFVLKTNSAIAVSLVEAV